MCVCVCGGGLGKTLACLRLVICFWLAKFGLVFGNEHIVTQAGSSTSFGCVAIVSGQCRLVSRYATPSPWCPYALREAAMRPLRELWGRRLLEGSLQDTDRGSGPATQQTTAAVQRLVEVVANSLKAAAAKLPSLSTTTTTAKTKTSTTIPTTISTTKQTEPAQLQDKQKQNAGSCSSDGRPPTAAAAGVGPRGGRWAGWMPRLLFRMDSNGGHRYVRSKQQVRFRGGDTTFYVAGLTRLRGCCPAPTQGLPEHSPK